MNHYYPYPKKTNIPKLLPPQHIEVVLQFSANYSQTVETTNNGASDVITLHPTKGLTAHVEWSFTAPTGLTLPFLKRIHFKN